MTAFKPVRADGRSYRDVIVDLFKDADYGRRMTYGELAEALGVSSRDRTTVQQSARNANKVLLKIYKRGLKCIVNVGYRVIQPNEHMLVATNHQSKATRAMRTALTFYDGADLTRMTDVERRLHHGQQLIAVAVMASHEHLDRRIRKIEDLLASKTIDAD
jgi:hypothetical protein